MAFLNDNVFDSGLSYAQTNGTRLDICSSEPATYAAVAGVSLGNKTSLVTGTPQDGATDGRRVIVPAITDGTVSATGTATHFALTDGSSILVATGTITSQSVTSGNTFTLDAISLTLRDATSV